MGPQTKKGIIYREMPIGPALVLEKEKIREKSMGKDGCKDRVDGLK